MKYVLFNRKVFKHLIYVYFYMCGLKSSFYYDHPVHNINQVITLSDIADIQM